MMWSGKPKNRRKEPDARTVGGARPTEIRVRPLHVHASVTWPSREQEPLLSVSAGWDSRERTGFRL